MKKNKLEKQDEFKHQLKYLFHRLVGYIEKAGETGKFDHYEFYAGHEAIRTIHYWARCFQGKEEIKSYINKEVGDKIENIWKLAEGRLARREHPKLILIEMMEGVERLVKEYDVDIRYEWEKEEDNK